TAGTYLDGIAMRSMQERGSDLAGGLQHGDAGRVAGGLVGVVGNTVAFVGQKLAEWSHIPGLQRVPQVVAAVTEAVAEGVERTVQFVQRGVETVVNGIANAGRAIAHFFGF